MTKFFIEKDVDGEMFQYLLWEHATSLGDPPFTPFEATKIFFKEMLREAKLNTDETVRVKLDIEEVYNRWCSCSMREVVECFDSDWLELHDKCTDNADATIESGDFQKLVDWFDKELRSYSDIEEDNRQNSLGKTMGFLVPCDRDKGVIYRYMDDLELCTECTQKLKNEDGSKEDIHFKKRVERMDKPEENLSFMYTDHFEGPESSIECDECGRNTFDDDILVTTYVPRKAVKLERILKDKNDE